MANIDENSNVKGYNLRKSVSTVGFNKGSSNLNLREARSFTGSLEELKHSVKTQMYYNQHEHNTHCPDQTCNVHSVDLCTEKGYVTKEVSSSKVFLVMNEMLTYRGKRYSLNDIATRWKKDCRMWLWKNKMNRRNKSVGELREKIQNLKLLNRQALL